MRESIIELWRPTGHEVIRTSADRLTIGRSPGNDIVLAEDTQVSRLHAVLENVSGAWLLRDIGSRNGCWVNGMRISGQRRLAAGDALAFGRTRMAVRLERRDELEPTLGSAQRPILTPREHDVLTTLIAPMVVATGTFTETPSTRRIAAALWVTDAAVKQHLLRLYDKFGISGVDGGSRRMRLANEALRRGAVTVGQANAAAAKLSAAAG